MLSKTDDPTSLGAFLRRRRERMRITAREVADDLDLGCGQYLKIENDVRCVGIDILLMLSDYYVVGLRDLVTLHKWTWGCGPSANRRRKSVRPGGARDIVQRYRIKYGADGAEAVGMRGVNAPSRNEKELAYAEQDG